MKTKKNDIVQFASILIFILLVNVIGSQWYDRFDLTQEKRYSLSSTSKELIRSLDDYLYIEVYLEGDFPAGIERLSRESEHILNEFQSENRLIQYSFINPTESSDEKTKNEIISQLFEKGLNPTTLQVKDGEGYSEKIIIPGALVKYGSNEIAVELLKNQIAQSPNQNIEQSIQELEYEFVNAIKKITKPSKPNIALLTGHGELEGEGIKDLTQTLSEEYSLNRIDLRAFEIKPSGEPDLNKKLNELKSQKVLLIAKPKNKFENLDKFFIDQFIMNGGRVIWMLDATNADIDSLSNKGTFLVHSQNDLNLEDQLFKYGVRINKDLIKDISCSKIPIPSGFINDIPQWQLIPWKYFPVVIPTSGHTITNQLNAVKFDFASSIDTIKTNTKINKTILLESSPYTKLVQTPYEISLKKALEAPVQEEYNRGSRATAVLLEGNFESIFKNRLNHLSKTLPYQASSEFNRMIVISDGDVAKNQLSRGMALPLGYDKYEKRQYGNKMLILNSIDYLLEEDAFINIRNRELKLRLLDLQKISKEKKYWQFINIGIPILVILLFGLIKQYRRKKKYS